MVKISSSEVIDTATNLTANYGSENPPIYNFKYVESDTGKYKIGDGTTSYASLTYVEIVGGGSMMITEIENDTITLTNEYQTIVTDTPSAPTYYQGWIDLTNMASGDTIIIQMSIDGKIHTQIQYSDAQVMPLVNVSKLMASSTYLIQVKQTAGSAKSIGFKFYSEA